MGQKVELIYTKFVSLISSDPIVQTLLPMTPEGEVCDVEGNCIDAADDELFKLTSSEGEFAVEREATSLDSGEGAFNELLIFEQELAARMNAMNSASDNAKELKKNL